jgi:hypothetical protein
MAELTVCTTETKYEMHQRCNHDGVPYYTGIELVQDSGLIYRDKRVKGLMGGTGLKMGAMEEREGMLNSLRQS